MTSTLNMTDEEIRTRGLEAVRRELGPAGLIRFLRQFRLGHGDYSVERHEWLDKLSLEEIVDEIQKNRK